MTSWAKVGAKCQCVDDGRWGFLHLANELMANLPKAGLVYTIRGIFVGEGGETGIRLESLNNTHIPTSSGEEIGFRVSRFRPLITKTQEEDLSMFLELLQKQEEPA